ncbi:MAG TPA: radical SAM family heme chaperone HemW [Candidatus Limnocylindrales bacterium]
MSEPGIGAPQTAPPETAPPHDGQPEPPVALYVHVPFCVSRCPYCDFVVYAGADARGPRSNTGRLYDALARELELRADALDARFGSDRPSLQSVFFGGGTPSLIPGERLAELLDTIRVRFGLAPDAEVTLEANPGSDERGDVAAFQATGVSRLSLGAQSFDAGELHRLGRRHSPEDVAVAVAEARAAGFTSLSLDLLYDVPDQSVAGWERTLRGALALGPDHLSLYALTLDDPGAEGLTGETGDHLATTAGALKWRERARRQQNDDRAADQYELAFELLAADGWRGYEISNWARPGHESRHNLAYWERRPYEAVGPGAHAFDGVVRRWNAARLDRYVAALIPHLGSPVLPPGGSERLDRATAAGERLILALRLDRGISAAQAAEPPFALIRDWAETSGLVEQLDIEGEPRLRLTVRGRLLSNEVFSRLL